MHNDQVRTSKFLSLVLRHKPEQAGLTLDESGWCGVDDLLKGCASQGHRISRNELDTIVAENDKKRFHVGVTLAVRACPYTFIVVWIEA